MCLHPYYIGEGVAVECGNCLYCRKKRSKSWVIRCMYEIAQKKTCHMIGLTYNKYHINKEYNLVYQHVQNMFKLMRKRGFKFSYLCAGEYGSKMGRPHYHILIFGLTSDQIHEAFGKPNMQNFVRIQNESNGVWTKGNVHIGYISGPKMSAYVTQYSLKKLKKKDYKGKREPPFIRMSKGVGNYLLSNKTEVEKVFRQGYISYGGRKYSIPRYYFKKLGIDRAEYYEKFVNNRTDELIEEYGKDPFIKLPSPEMRGDTCMRILLNHAHDSDCVMKYKGFKRIMTKDFMYWLNARRILYDFSLRVRLKERMDI